MTDVIAFTADHVCRITCLSPGQLRYWDKTDFFSPTVLDDHSRRVFGRIYSFRDVVGLRTIAILREQVPLQELRKVGAWLAARHDTPWSSLKFALKGKRAVFLDPASGIPTEPSGAGQKLLWVGLQPIADKMSKAADALKKRDPDQVGQIERNRYVVHNAWVVAGTRVPTEAVWSFHEEGYSTAQIITEYPRLRPADVSAAIRFERNRRRAA